MNFYQAEEKDLIYWTSGLILVGISYSQELERPDELIEAYLGLYPSDLGIVSLDYNLESGWNLVSLPFVLDNYSIDTVFSGIIDDVDTIYTYKNRDWNINTPVLPPTLSDFNELELGYAYWIKTNTSVNFSKTGSVLIPASTQEGTLVSPPEIQLTDGWNLIGVHANKPVAASIYLKGLEGKYDSLWRYVPSVHGLAYGSIVEMAGDPVLIPGQGYWIHVTDPAGASFVPSSGGI